MSQSKSHVVVIGAGISGLAAAHELSKHSSSVQVTVLEARNRLGGRLDTRHHLLSGPQGQEIPLDFGASWIHGIDPTNPVMPLAQVSQAALIPTNTDVIFYRPGQQPLSEDESNHYWAVLSEIFGQAQDHSRAHKNEISAQTSFRDWFDHHLKTRQSRDPRKPNFMSARELKIVPLLAQFWADENAIPLNKVSLKYMDAEILPPGDHCIMANGYDRILDTLCKDMGKDVDIRLEHVVDRIEYDESNVRISTNKGVFVADHVIVTLPLGVLKSNAVTFSPPLPQRKRQAIERLGFGTMVKVVLSFPRCFWPETKHFVNFLPIPSSIPNPKLSRHLNKKQMEALTTYMNDLANYTSLMPIHGTPVLIAYATNESAEAFGKLTDQEAMQVLLCQLSHYFDVLVTDPESNQPTSVFMTRWNSDPYARGSYTSIPIGAHQSDLAEFEIPVGARLTLVPSKIKNDRISTGSKAATLYRKQYRKPGPLSPPLRRQVELVHLPGDLQIQMDQVGGGRSHGPIRSRDNSFHVFEGKGLQHPLSLHLHEDDWKVERADGQVQALAIHEDGFRTLSSASMVGDSNATMIATSLAYDDFTGSQEDVLRRLYQLLNSHLGGGEEKKITTGPVQVAEPANMMRLIAVDDAAEGRIHFAGEHTTPTSFASVHGALMTGQREAGKILRKTL